jgi:hypothetical protein
MTEVGGTVRTALLTGTALGVLSLSCIRETKPLGFATAQPGDEDCTDGSDNDSDGLVDCEDADCAMVMDCAYSGATINVRLTGGGSMLYEREFKRDIWTSWIDVTLLDVQGSVHIYALDGTSTCDWSLQSVTGAMSWEPYEVRDDIEGDPVWTRNGFTVDSACTLDGSRMFPEPLIEDQSFTTIDGGSWYHGTVSNYSLDTTSYYSGPAYSRVVGWALEQWEIDPLDKSNSWSFTVG